MPVELRTDGLICFPSVAYIRIAESVQMVHVRTGLQTIFICMLPDSCVWELQYDSPSSRKIRETGPSTCMHEDTDTWILNLTDTPF
jgi:hypothetical protein